MSYRTVLGVVTCIVLAAQISSSSVMAVELYPIDVELRDATGTVDITDAMSPGQRGYVAIGYGVRSAFDSESWKTVVLLDGAEIFSASGRANSSVAHTYTGWLWQTAAGGAPGHVVGAGHHTLIMIIDQESEVAEAEEGNNVFVRHFSVGVAPPALPTPGAYEESRDYNGDGVTDLAVYQKATGNWFIRSLGPVGPGFPPITFGQKWGEPDMVPVPGEYNGDSLADLAMYQQTTGNWFIRSLGDPNAPPVTFGQNWGGPRMLPCPDDFNGDGLTDLAAYEVDSGNWFIRSLGPVGPGFPPITFGQNWGNSDMIPVPGDYDGDNVADLAVYARSTGNWFIRSLGDTNANAQVFAKNWGTAGMVPAAADYDADGVTDLAVYELATGNWFIQSRISSNAPPITFGQNWGGPGMIPVPGDYDLDGIADLAVYETATGNWFIRSLGDPNAPPITFGQNWGDSSMVPVIGD